MRNDRPILITGASGFIAKHIVVQALDAGYAVRASVRSLDRSAAVRDAIARAVQSRDDLDQRLSFVALDLNADTGWSDALRGVAALVHTASPFPLVQPKNADDLIRPAVDGTRRALNAAHSAGVRRVVLTSSSVAIMYAPMRRGRTALDESDWSELTRPEATPYVRSKTMAERAAWDLAKTNTLDLTAINPGLVVGPMLDATFGTSMRVIQRILQAKDPMLPQIGFPMVDVRDIAAMHVLALSTPESIGKRYLGGDEFVWMPDIARMLARAHPARRIPTRRAPNFIMRTLALFDAEVRTILPNLDQSVRLSADQARRDFGITFRSAESSLLAAADSLLTYKLA